MEFSEYGNLHESRVQRSVERLCRFTIQTASALEHLESKNIIHQAVDSNNCFVVSKDQVSTIWEAAWLSSLALDLKSGDPEFKSCSSLWSMVFNSLAALVRSQLLCLLLVGFLNMLCLFELFVSPWRVLIEVHICFYTLPSQV